MGHAPIAGDLHLALTLGVAFALVVAGPALRVPLASATPTIKLAVDTMASLEPRTAARIHPLRPLRCTS